MILEATSRGLTTPDGVNLKSVAGTGVAYDNNDRFVALQNGKATLNETVGILYQPIQVNPIETEICQRQLMEASPRGTTKKRRKRAYSFDTTHIAPYHKKPKVTSGLISVNDPKRTDMDSFDFSSYETFDLLWVASNIYNNETPSWFGWNAKYTNQDVPQHKIFYLQHIKASPTKRCVVLETMNRALTIAEECNLPSINLTYDLSIAKDAYAIQGSESPKFDRLHISLGAFHQEGSFFNAIGKMVDGSGVVYMLQDCEVLGDGHTTGFMSGKSYKKCKAVHTQLALVMRMFHLDLFAKSQTDLVDLQLVLEKSLESLNMACAFDEFSISSNLQNILQRYNAFCTLTRQGEHGKAAQFWMLYIDAIDIYQAFARSHRLGDFKLLLKSSFEMLKYFFVFNNRWYAKYGSLHLSKLLTLKDDHPELYKQFTDGLFAIARTKNSFHGRL